MKKVKNIVDDIRLNVTMELFSSRFNFDTSGVIYKNEDGYIFEFTTLDSLEDTPRLVSIPLSYQDTLDDEDVNNVNEIIDGYYLEFVGYKEEENE